MKLIRAVSVVILLFIALSGLNAFLKVPVVK